MNTVPIRITPLAADADHAGLYHYALSGLIGYWLSPGLFEIARHKGEDFISFPQFDEMQAAIGIHLCGLPRPLRPDEIHYLRGELDLSQGDLGRLLGYRDKQRVAAAERRADDSRPLAPTADMLLRNHYLGMLGAHDLVGDDYRDAAMALSLALRDPVHPAEETHHLLAA
jgi:hypothetical protein